MLSLCTPNPIENVFVENPEEGTWCVTVRADELLLDGRAGAAQTDAVFALVVSGVVIEIAAATAPPDFNGDGLVDSGDVSAFMEAYQSKAEVGGSASGRRGSDVSAFLSGWFAAAEGGK